MILEPAPTILRAHPQYQLLLEAYLERDRQEQERQEEFSGWVDRINSVEGIEPEFMSRVHGKLISLGLLKFELGDRLEGIRYQISPLARRALKQVDMTEESLSEDDELDELLEEESQAIDNSF